MSNFKLIIAKDAYINRLKSSIAELENNINKRDIPLVTEAKMQGELKAYSAALHAFELQFKDLTYGS